MTRSELIEQVMMRLPHLSEEQASDAVKGIFATMSDALVKGDRIELRGFGSFELHHRKAGRARNPRTGERVEVGERFVAHFKPGKQLRDRVNQGREQ